MLAPRRHPGEGPGEDNRNRDNRQRSNRPGPPGGGGDLGDDGNGDGGADDEPDAGQAQGQAQVRNIISEIGPRLREHETVKVSALPDAKGFDGCCITVGEAVAIASALGDEGFEDLMSFKGKSFDELAIADQISVNRRKASCRILRSGQSRHSQPGHPVEES